MLKTLLRKACKNAWLHLQNSFRGCFFFLIALRAVQDPLASTKHLALFFFFPKELKNFHCFLGRDAAAGSRVLWKSRWVILVTEVFLEVMMPKKYLSGDKSSFWGHHQGGQSDLLIYLFFEPSAPPPKVGAPNLGAGSVLGFLPQKPLGGDRKTFFREAFGNECYEDNVLVQQREPHTDCVHFMFQIPLWIN